MYVCEFVCVSVRACARACMCVWYVCVCVCFVLFCFLHRDVDTSTNRNLQNAQTSTLDDHNKDCRESLMQLADRAGQAKQSDAVGRIATNNAERTAREKARPCNK